MRSLSRVQPPFLALLVLLAALAPLAAQDRTLHWNELAVTARLDADGALHIRERQTMVFTGNWNGGERDFRLEFGQRLKFEKISRFDSIGGVEVELREGSLDQIDEYSWTSDKQLRWRSRLPSDPLFDNAELIYILEYQLSNILEREGDLYILDHDFAFTDRAGEIRRFTLRLDIDPAWDPPADLPTEYSAGPLEPGTGYVIKAQLKRLAAGEPSGIHRSASAAERGMLAAVLIATALLLLLGLYRREKALGRFAPLLPVEKIDESWLHDNVLAHRPEVVGAAWDERTSAAEVAAVLARLVAEGKIESRVEKKSWGPFSRSILHLKLLRGRQEFDGYENTLISAFFVEGDETSSEIVSEHYKKTGFDPASKIRQGLDHEVKAMARDEGLRGSLPPWWITALLALAAAALLAAAILLTPKDLLLVIIGGVQLVVLSIASIVVAYHWRDRVSGLRASALGWVLPMAAAFGGLYWLLFSGAFHAGFWALAGLTMLWILFWRSTINAAKIRQTTSRIALRKRLAAAREYFRAELKKPRPQLRDSWFPYLLAFGLGPQIDRWFHAFGAAGSNVSHATSSTTGFSSSSSSRTGGGGAFGGAGASASWAVAAGSMASGVAAASSSSSGGGGGSSSGGGGGGGW